MDAKRLRQADAESILLNSVFKEAIAEYQNKWREKALECKTPDEAFHAVLAVQAADEFVRILESYVDDGIIETLSDNQKEKFANAEQESKKIRKIVR